MGAPAPVIHLFFFFFFQTIFGRSVLITKTKLVYFRRRQIFTRHPDGGLSSARYTTEAFRRISLVMPDRLTLRMVGKVMAATGAPARS